MLNGVIMFRPQTTEKVMAMALPTFSQPFRARCLICHKCFKTKPCIPQAVCCSYKYCKNRRRFS